MSAPPHEQRRRAFSSLLRRPARSAPNASADERSGELLRGTGAERVLWRLDWQVVRPLDGLLQGEYRSLFPGRGLDLAEVREYQPGDDVRLMDWNVTARTGQAHVRQYHDDREVTAWLLLDTSASVDFGTARMRKCDLVLDFAGAMARLLIRRGNRVGAVIFSGGVDRVLPPRGGRQQVLTLVHELIRPHHRPAARTTDLAGVLNRSAQMITRRSLVFVISDFFADPRWEAPLRRLSQRHEVTAVWVRDPREEHLPDIGAIVLEDAETGEQIDVNTQSRAFRRRFEAQVEQRRQCLASTFARCGVEVLSLSTDRDLLNSLIEFTQRRRLTPRPPLQFYWRGGEKWRGGGPQTRGRAPARSAPETWT